MFTKTATYYDALYHFKDYKQACTQLHELVQHKITDATTLLDVACGTGKHVEHLQDFYQVEGLDLNPELLKVAQSRCPEVAFHEADMTNFDLQKTYDVVTCLFSSIAYVQTVENLNKAIACMAKHVRQNGLLLIEPWITPEKYWVNKLTSNYTDLPDLKISWMYISELRDMTSVFNIHYMVGTPEGISQFEEKHVMGLWTDAQYRQAFKNMNIDVQYDEKGLFGRGMYYGIKP